ncbi:MAG TPA: ATP-binding protein [Bacteroidales bacterium]|nr:ATP-binding protein [Bacteroidales bacterium]
MKLEFEIHGGDFVNAGSASSKVKSILKQLNINSELIKKTVISLYEAEVNVVAHADKGKITINISSSAVEIEVNDRGPGIEDIELAMKDGYSTATEEVREMGFGAGMGLSNIRRNSDFFGIDSTPGRGTKAKIRIEIK